MRAAELMFLGKILIPSNFSPGRSVIVHPFTLPVGFKSFFNQMTQAVKLSCQQLAAPTEYVLEITQLFYGRVNRMGGPKKTIPLPSFTW